MQEGQACLDYGTVRVCDSKPLPLVLKNNGKYPVQYQFTLRSALAREVYVVQPEAGAVDPGKDVTVQVVFNPSATLQRELTMVNAPDITLAIIEPLTSNKVGTVAWRVRAPQLRIEVCLLEVFLAGRPGTGRTLVF